MFLNRTGPPQTIPMWNHCGAFILYLPQCDIFSFMMISMMGLSAAHIVQSFSTDQQGFPQIGAGPTVALKKKILYKEIEDDHIDFCSNGFTTKRMRRKKCLQVHL